MARTNTPTIRVASNGALTSHRFGELSFGSAVAVTGVVLRPGRCGLAAQVGGGGIVLVGGGVFGAPPLGAAVWLVGGEVVVPGGDVPDVGAELQAAAASKNPVKSAN